MDKNNEVHKIDKGVCRQDCTNNVLPVFNSTLTGIMGISTISTWTIEINKVK